MTPPAPDTPDDERLRQLLQVERRLQDLVRAAREDAVRRVAEARDRRDQRLRDALEEADRVDAGRARAEAAAHADALAELDRAGAALPVDPPGGRIDELARRVLHRAIAWRGEPS